MEPECSLPCWQEPAACSWPDVEKSSSRHLIPPLWHTFYFYFPFAHGCSKRSLQIFTPNPVCFVLHSCHVTIPSHPFWCDHPNCVWWSLQIIKLLIIEIFSSPCYFHPLRLNSLFSDTLTLCTFHIWYQVRIYNNRWSYNLYISG